MVKSICIVQLNSCNSCIVRKLIIRSVMVLLLIVLAFVVYYCWRSFPIIAGFGAKGLCSCMYVSGRAEDDVKKEELGSFPFTLARYEVNHEELSVTGSVWGLAKRKAIYRPGL